MSRDINPNLFSSETEWNNEVQARKARTSVESIENIFPGPPMTTESLRTDKSRVDPIKKRMDQFESNLEKVAIKLEESIRLDHIKFERLAQGLGRTQDTVSKQYQEVAARYAQLAGKVNERRLVETKIQDMVDRHNQIVQSFEHRISQLQKVLSEQELQLANYSSALEEARQSMARMKRL